MREQKKNATFPIENNEKVSRPKTHVDHGWHAKHINIGLMKNKSVGHVRFARAGGRTFRVQLAHKNGYAKNIPAPAHTHTWLSAFKKQSICHCRCYDILHGKRKSNQEKPGAAAEN